ncbi:alpha/beta-hydrolase [Tothia fuscella]|uniref:Alpha/beta-hydrolase n=1 Tax=Tothia fuscella TaxID=1048955 RepID=A0A9P4NV86_9PEZI|nr:alpha/beta-hydrolase [Tothia fuscella]
MSEDIIPHVSINHTAASTILFIHGALASPRDFLNVSSHLPSYHSLIPSLPSHSQSQFIKTFSISTTIDLLAVLVRSNAKSSKSHVVGHSLGAEVALAYAAKYPELVETLYISGYRRLVIPPYISSVLPYVASGSKQLENMIPRATVGRWMDIDFNWPITGPLKHDIDPKSIPETPNSVKLSKEILEALSSKEEVHPLPMRTLIVAATKGNWYLPTNDSIPEAKRILQTVKLGNAASRAAQVPSMRHPWNLQDPTLFARSVEAWIERSDLLEEFEEIQ